MPAFNVASATATTNASPNGNMRVTDNKSASVQDTRSFQWIADTADDTPQPFYVQQSVSCHFTRSLTVDGQGGQAEASMTGDGYVPSNTLNFQDSQSTRMGTTGTVTSDGSFAEVGDQRMPFSPPPGLTVGGVLDITTSTSVYSYAGAGIQGGNSTASATSGSNTAQTTRIVVSVNYPTPPVPV